LSVETATLLVVDDEGLVRALVRRMLEPDVCRVVEAEDGESALRLIERGQPAIDVVLTDLVMPGIDGFDIIAVLARHRPDLPVICMSGFASVAASRLTVPFIPKPFSIESLRAGLEPMLARGRELRHTGALDLVAAALELRRQRAEPPGTS
jgi:two-component system, cell cycle sensor histidine kinase and response regulator CckA